MQSTLIKWPKQETVCNDGYTHFNKQQNAFLKNDRKEILNFESNTIHNEKEKLNNIHVLFTINISCFFVVVPSWVNVVYKFSKTFWLWQYCSRFSSIQGGSVVGHSHGNEIDRHPRQSQMGISIITRENLKMQSPSMSTLNST